ncbi:MAG TPA: agmatinase, partial [Planctomycetota bacterium]|nr:agmatinase [Planctomycetota bacterium]
YDGTTTFLKGTAKGPRAVITASQQVELWDEELEQETAMLCGIHTLPFPLVETLPPDQAPDLLESLARPHVEAGKCLVTIGGEHAVTLGPARAVAAKYPKLSVLHIDAHGDLRAEYDGTPFGHGCIMRRLLEDLKLPIVQAGIRSLCPEEAAIIREGRVKTFYRHKFRDFEAAAKDVVDARPTEDVYVSVDVDALDPALMAGTGTPEPGGLSWWELLALLRRVASSRRVVAFDVVETIPLEGQAVAEFVTARLIYRFMGYIQRSRQTR